jgi:hypothetical protein
MFRSAIVMLIAMLGAGCASPQQAAGTRAANPPPASQLGSTEIPDITGKYRVEKGADALPPCEIAR